MLSCYEKKYTALYGIPHNQSRPLTCPPRGRHELPSFVAPFFFQFSSKSLVLLVFYALFTGSPRCRTVHLQHNGGILCQKAGGSSFLFSLRAEEMLLWSYSHGIVLSARHILGKLNIVVFSETGPECAPHRMGTL